MEALKKIRTALQANLLNLKEAKKNGTKVIGYLPGGYFPEELAIAAGAIPVCMIRGGDNRPVEASVAYIDRWMDTFCRYQIGAAISGDDQYYNLIDILVAPITDANIRSIADQVGYFTDIDIFNFGVPHTKDEAALRYYHHGIKKLKKMLEQLTGETITDQKLKDAIILCNQERELLSKISLMRKSDTVLISAKDFVMLNHASMILDKKWFVETLSELAKDLERSTSDQVMGPRLMLMGPTLAMGDHRILEIIQKAGGQVVIEEFAEGIKTYRHQVKISDDLMASLAEAYFMDRAVPAWFRPATGRMEHLVSLAKDFNVDGVICYQLLYRDCDKLESYYLPEIFRKEAGVSMLTLESDYDPGETGQLQTRIESYIESIEG